MWLWYKPSDGTENFSLYYCVERVEVENETFSWPIHLVAHQLLTSCKPVFHPCVIFKASKKTPLEQCAIFKVNVLGTGTMSGASIVNFEYILHVITPKFEKINAGWTWEITVSDNTFVFSNCVIIVSYRAGKICWATCFNFHLPNIRLWKDKFSQRHFQKIGWRLTIWSISNKPNPN